MFVCSVYHRYARHSPHDSSVKLFPEILVRTYFNEVTNLDHLYAAVRNQTIKHDFTCPQRTREGTAVQLVGEMKSVVQLNLEGTAYIFCLFNANRS